MLTFSAVVINNLCQIETFNRAWIIGGSLHIDGGGRGEGCCATRQKSRKRNTLFGEFSFGRRNIPFFFLDDSTVISPTSHRKKGNSFLLSDYYMEAGGRIEILEETSR